MNEELLNGIILLVGAMLGGGGVVGMINAIGRLRPDNRKTESEAYKNLVATINELSDGYQKRFDSLEKELKELRTTTEEQESEIHGLKSLVGKLRAIAKKLYDQVRDAGQQPNLSPSELKELG